MGRVARLGLQGLIDGWPRALDASVAAAATVASLAVMTTSREAGAALPDAKAVGLLVLAGLCLLFRRRLPATVLLAVTGLTTVYLALDYPGGAELPLLLLALYTCVAEGRRWIGLAVTLLVVGSSAGYRLLVDGDDPLIVVVTISVVVLVASLGEVVNAHRRLRAEVTERIRLARAEQALETEAARSAERLELARELHDVLAHTITAVAVQAGAVADGLAPDSEAHTSLRSMRTTARDAMRQLQITIGVLRDGRPPPDQGSHVLALEDLQQLANGIRDAGLRIDLDVPERSPPLTSATALAAFRIVQESLTNVLRHAGATQVRVRLATDDRQLLVVVVDDGPTAPHRVPVKLGSGFGMVGMRERAQALGGTFHAGPTERGGFEVVVRLPLELETL